jgi:hypothetical protein
VTAGSAPDAPAASAAATRTRLAVPRGADGPKTKKVFIMNDLSCIADKIFGIMADGT